MATSTKLSESLSMDPAAAAAVDASGGEDDLRRRFLLDLEFVQALANPYYLRCTSPARVI